MKPVENSTQQIWTIGMQVRCIDEQFGDGTLLTLIDIMPCDEIRNCIEGYRCTGYRFMDDSYRAWCGVPGDFEFLGGHR